MAIQEVLGVKPIINAGGPATRLSGGAVAPEVAEAMAQAAQECARIEDLQEAAGRYLAEVTGAEAGYVVSGAAGGLAVGAAACIAGLDVAAMDQLPDTTGLRDEIIIQRAHVTAYSHALRNSGAKLIDVGYVGYPGQGITWPWQIEAAINERTAAIAFSIGSVRGIVQLEEIVEIAHKHGLPVIVDAAAALPPPENLRRFIDAGADLVTFSGGKAIGGPQASGILVGRADLIESVALQHQDMDVFPATWTWRDRYLASGQLPGPPHHGLGRPMKVGKEQIVGLVVALKRFLAMDHAAERQRQVDQIETIFDGLEDLEGVRVGWADRPEGSYPAGVIYLDEEVLGTTVEALINELIEGNPPIAVSQGFLDDRGIGIVSQTLQPGQEEILAMRLRGLLARG